MRKTLKQLGRDTGYLLAGLPIAIPAFVITVVGVAAGVATAVVWIGVPVLAATLLAMRGMAAAGREQLAEVTGESVPRPRHKQARPGASGLRRLLTAVADGQSWMNLLWSVINFPVAILGFVVAATWWAATVASLVYPLYGWIFRRLFGSDGDGMEYATRWLGWGDSYLAVAALGFLGGLVLAVLLPLALRGCALMQAGIARSLLTGLAENGSPRLDREQRLDSESTRVRDRIARA
ncbi:hypothetical protein GCM10027447_04100 [Glycomyces halotolerans]